MKFIILKENLKQGLATVAHLSTKNINLPILNNVLIKAKKDGIELTSTNLEISINNSIRAKIETEGEFTVDSKVINEYVSLLPDDKIEIELKNDELSVKCQNYKTKIKGQEAGDFPILPKIDGDNYYSVSIGDFKNALSNVIFSVSINETRLELSGVLFNFDGKGKLNLVATDSYRLSEKGIKYKENGLVGDMSIIVPSRTVQELIRILSNFKMEEQLGSDDEIRIYPNENQIFFSFASTNLMSRLISGSYPDYKQIIPDKEKTIISINKNILVKAVKAGGIFSKTGINDIGLKNQKNSLHIYSSSSQAGENFVDVECKTRGDNNEIFINYKYFLEGLNAINSENVIIKIIDNNTPCLITAENDDSFLYLVMPLKQ